MGSSAAGGDSPFADIYGKVAVLTLGIEENEGITLAVEFVKRGCRVVLVGCPLARVTKACNQICESTTDAEHVLPGSRVDGADLIKAVELDATRGDQAVEEAIQEAWCAFGGIDILVSYATDSGTTKPIVETSESDFDKIMAANVKALWLVSKSVARKMQQEGRPGSLLFLTSISGTERGIYPGVGIHGTSMAAVNHLTTMMAMELGKYRIRVNAIACGLAESNIMLESNDKNSLQILAKKVVPLQRWLQFPNDIIGIILWLASDSSTFVTDQPTHVFGTSKTPIKLWARSPRGGKGEWKFNEGTVAIVDGGLSLRRPRMGEYRSRL